MFRPTGRFDPECLFHPRSVLLVGAETETGRAIAANLAAFPGRITHAEPGALPDEAHDLAILACDGASVPTILPALAQAGTYAVICAAPVPGFAAALAAPGAEKLRVLGPNSFGLVVPALKLNASTAHLAPAPGRVALVSQSAALCRAVIDWAGPNGVGFSYVVGTGGNLHTGFAMVLDFLSRDTGTGAILLDIRTIRRRRLFMAAARAAARLRPVVAIRAGGRLEDPSGRADAVFDAALRRAGVLRVTGLANFFGAAEVLTRAKPARSDLLAIATNAVGPGHMAADAALALGLRLLEPDPIALTVLRLHLPAGPADPGIVWTGADRPGRLADAAGLLAGVPEVGGIVVVLAPTGPADDVAIAALAAAKSSLRVPLLVCVLGETTGAPHRRVLADAGIPAFATPESAVRAFGHLVEQRRARAAAAELPPRRVLDIAPDHLRVTQILARARADCRTGLMQDEALTVLAAYGIATLPTRVAPTAAETGPAAAALGFPVAVKRRRHASPGAADDPPVALDITTQNDATQAATRMGEAPDGFIVQRQIGRARELRLTVHDDPLFGPAIGFGLGGTAADLLGDTAFELPPLNLALARGLIARTRAAGLLEARHDLPAADREAVAGALVRISQLVLDHPEIAAIDVNPLFAGLGGVTAADAWIGLRPHGESADFSVMAYPEEWSETFDAKGTEILIRPIRPEDAEAHAAFFTRLTPEDIRYRFFNQLRELQPEQIARMTQVDYDREIAFVAVSGTDTVGVARLVREPGTLHGEFAVVVQPSMKGRGLARRLMEKLGEWGAAQGMTAIIGQVLAENAPMLAFMRRMGATIRRLPEEPDVVEATIAVPRGTDRP